MAISTEIITLVGELMVIMLFSALLCFDPKTREFDASFFLVGLGISILIGIWSGVLTIYMGIIPIMVMVFLIWRAYK